MTQHSPTVDLNRYIKNVPSISPLREDPDLLFQVHITFSYYLYFFLTFQAKKKGSIQIMVRFSKGELVQYVPFGSATHTGRFQNKGRILDPIIDTTNSFTGAYMVPHQLYIFF